MIQDRAKCHAHLLKAESIWNMPLVYRGEREGRWAELKWEIWRHCHIMNKQDGNPLMEKGKDPPPTLCIHNYAVFVCSLCIHNNKQWNLHKMSGSVFCCCCFFCSDWGHCSNHRTGISWWSDLAEPYDIQGMEERPRAYGWPIQYVQCFIMSAKVIYHRTTLREEKKSGQLATFIESQRIWHTIHHIP